MAIEKENILDGDKKGSNQPDSPLPKKKNLVLRGWIVVLTFLVLAVVPYVILTKSTHPYPKLINNIAHEVREILTN